MPSRRMIGGQAVREIYERYPYPGTPPGRPSAAWRLPHPTWLVAMTRPGEAVFRPRRILVAGCGTGREAFALARRVPGADIVAVDFSPRSIAVARASQRRLPFARRIRFLVADLADPGLHVSTGGDFDFISCHGVLSYVPNPRRVLKCLGQCLAPDGALYLGVNGSTHHSVRWRQALPVFGIDPLVWRESPAARNVLRVMDAIAERTPAPRLARRSAAYLSGDVFGPPFRNLALADWRSLAEQAGWHFRGSASCVEAIRGLCERGLVTQLLPRLRAEVHALEELLIPSAFHGLVFTKQPAPAAPWTDPDALLDWRVVRLPLYRLELPSRPPGTARFASRALNLLVETRLDAVATALLRTRQPAAIREIARTSRLPVRARALGDTLYMLYLLGVVELIPAEPL